MICIIVIYSYYNDKEHFLNQNFLKYERNVPTWNIISTLLMINLHHSYLFISIKITKLSADLYLSTN